MRAYQFLCGFLNRGRLSRVGMRGLDNHGAEEGTPVRDRAMRIFLGLALVAAWFPICRPYLRVADDFHFAWWLMTGGIRLYFQEDGVWRILGHELAHAATVAHPLLPGVLAIATHCVAAMLLLAVLRRLLASESLALLLAAIFAVFPWADEVLMWASAYSYLLGTTFFLVVLCLLLGVFRLKRGVAVPLCVLCAALSLFGHEALFFALLVSGGVVFVREEGKGGMGRMMMAGAPAMGCGVWMVLYRTFPGRMPAEHVVLNLRTLLSGIYYQYTALEIFEPWMRSGTRELLFFGWSGWQFAGGAMLVWAVGLSARWALALPGAEGTAKKNNGMLIFLAVLVVAMVAIYAVGGGFSLDSRKKYPIVPVMLMCLGYGIERFAPRVRIHGGAILAVVLCGIATTWLQIGLWRYEAVRLDLLTDFLRTQKDPGSVRVEWDGRVQAAWPRSTRHWGTPVEQWVLTDAVRLKGALAPPVAYAGPVAAVKFDGERFAWVPGG